MRQLGLSSLPSLPVKAFRAPGPSGVFVENTHYQPRMWRVEGSAANDNKPRAVPRFHYGTADEYYAAMAQGLIPREW